MREEEYRSGNGPAPTRHLYTTAGTVRARILTSSGVTRTAIVLTMVGTACISISLTSLSVSGGAGPQTGCECNGYLHRGSGECKEQSSVGCGLWCYVSDSNTCRDTRPSIFGAPYSWSCQACEQEERGAAGPEDSGELFSILQSSRSECRQVQVSSWWEDIPGPV